MRACCDQPLLASFHLWASNFPRKAHSETRVVCRNGVLTIQIHRHLSHITIPGLCVLMCATLDARSSLQRYLCQPKRRQWFHLVRSIWLPTDSTLQLTSVISGVVPSAFALASYDAGRVSCAAGAALLGPWLVNMVLLYGIRSLEEEWVDMSNDVRAERANGLLWLHGLPATGVCVATLFCLALARSSGMSVI